MNLRFCVQALLLLWLSLTAVCGGPLAQPSDRKGLHEASVRTPQPRSLKNPQGPWPGAKRKFRRQRPRLSTRAPCLSEAGMKRPQSDCLHGFFQLHTLVCFSGAFQMPLILYSPCC